MPAVLILELLFLSISNIKHTNYNSNLAVFSTSSSTHWLDHFSDVQQLQRVVLWNQKYEESTIIHNSYITNKTLMSNTFILVPPMSSRLDVELFYYCKESRESY